MPDRAIIAILPAVSVGFIGGLITTMLQLEDGATLAVGLAGAVLVMLAAGSSVFGVRGEQGEKAIVGLLRGGCAVGLYGAMFLCIVSFLEGSVLAALLWALFGAAFAGVLTQLRVRERSRMRPASD